jgi:hypothetical protein
MKYQVGKILKGKNVELEILHNQSNLLFDVKITKHKEMKRSNLDMFIKRNELK